MRNKILNFLVCMMLLLTTIIVITPDDLKVKATSTPGKDEEMKSLNYSYIKIITENLSNIVNNPQIYPPGTLAKGREYGSDGEQYAAKEILQDEMLDLELYNPCAGPEPYLQQLEDLNAFYYPIKIFSPWTSLITKIDVIEKGLTIINHTDPNNITTEKITDFYISPYWNESVLNILYNKNLLTYNLSYENLSIINTPTEKQYFTTANITWFEDFISNTTIINIITNDTSVYNLSNLLNLTKTLFEDYYNFTFENLNTYNSSTWPTGYQRYDTNETDDYVMIEEDSRFNPFSNSTKWTPPTEYDNQLVTLLYRISSAFSSWLWYKTNTHCKGIIRYDTDNLTYNIDLDQTTFPYICINGSVGKPINQNVTNYNITYYINQEYNDSIESYNVIGQINGTDQNKTILVTCLYDSWWNGGTCDAAIGMAIVLAD